MRVELQGGWAEGDLMPLARIGDRIVPVSITVHLKGGRQPAFELRFEVIDGLPQCREVHVTSSDSDRGVKTLDLKAIRLTELAEDVFSLFASRIVDDGDGVVLADGPALSSDDRKGAVAAFQKERRGKSARKLTDAFLLEVAEVYRAHPAKPTAAVAAAFGVGPRAATLYVQKAADAGHLPATTRGKRRI